jgi:signal transduction histidine kinase
MLILRRKHFGRNVEMFVITLIVFGISFWIVTNVVASIGMLSSIKQDYSWAILSGVYLVYLFLNLALLWGKKSVSKITLIGHFGLTAVIPLGILMVGCVSQQCQLLQNFAGMTYGGWFHILYSIYIGGYFLLAEYILIQKYYKVKKSTHKESLKLLIIITLVFSSAGIVYSIVNLGEAVGISLAAPLMSIPVYLCLVYEMLQLNLFGIRKVYVELYIFVSIALAVLTARFILNLDNLSEILISNVVVVSVFVILCVFLLREVLMGVHNEDKLKQLNGNLNQLVFSKEDFMKMSSLQLRTPLTVILGYLSMLIEEQDKGYHINEETRKDLEIVYQSAHNLNDIVNDLMSANDINKGNFLINKMEIDLDVLISDILERKQEFFEEHHTKLTYKKTGKNFEYVCDGPKLAEAINNIVDNAVFYGKGKVKVLLSEQKDKFLISIQDNGIGISKKDAKQLWEKFERGANSANINPNGSGLGLYLAKIIMKNHNGDIWVESEEGQGSKFVLALPKLLE